MVAVIFDAQLGTLRIGKTLDDIENLIDEVCFYGITNIIHGMAGLGNGHWLKGFNRKGTLQCFISNVRIIEHVF